MSSVRLTQTEGVGSGSATGTLNDVPSLSLAFFELTGASAGDVYTLYLTKTGGQNPNVAYLGLTFDTLGAAAVPEPGSFVLASSAAVGLFGYTRLRRRRNA